MKDKSAKKLNGSNMSTKKKSKKEDEGSGDFDQLLQSVFNELENKFHENFGEDSPIADEPKTSQKSRLTSNKHTELHISGRIDSFIFGTIREPYYEEFKISNQLIINGEQNNGNFLESMFSLFLENNPFSEKSNLDVFNENIDLEKFKKLCPNFYEIYKTVLKNSHEKNEVVTQDKDIYLKSSIVRSTTFDHHSFLREIMDSPNFSNPLRVFSTDNFIEIFAKGEKIGEGQLDQLLELKQVEYDEDFDEDGEFLYTDKQWESVDKFVNNKLGFPLSLNPIAKTKQGSIQYDGFWPNDFFKFVLGDSKELYEEGLYAVIDQHYQYSPSKEIRLVFSNVSKCIFKFKNDLDYEKLMFLRCGLDEDLRQYAINYSDDINVFNYIAYDGSLLIPEETIYRDKGIQIEPTVNFADDDVRPVFCSLFVD